MTGADLKPFALFADLVDAERDDLAERLERRNLAKGETLFAEGDEADALVLVASGGVEVSTRRSEETLTVEAGGALGALALVAVGQREASAAGAEASALWLLRRSAFLRFAEDHPRGAFRIAAAVGAEAAQHARSLLAAGAPPSVDPPQRGE